VTELDPLIAALQPEDERFLKLHGWESAPVPSYAARRRQAEAVAKRRFRKEMLKVAYQVTAFAAAVGLVAWLIVVTAGPPAPQPAPAPAATGPTMYDNCKAFADILNNQTRLDWAVSNNLQVSQEAQRQADAAYHKMGC
jgi:hypothetical protein